MIAGKCALRWRYDEAYKPIVGKKCKHRFEIPVHTLFVSQHVETPLCSFEGFSGTVEFSLYVMFCTIIGFVNFNVAVVCYIVRSFFFARKHFAHYHRHLLLTGRYV